MMFRFSILVLLCLPVLAQGADGYHGRVDVNDFIQKMVDKHQFSEIKLQKLFSSVHRRQSIVDAISRPAEKRLTWKDYRKIFLTKKRIDSGASFLKANRELLAQIENEYEVPAEIIVAIVGVETFYGTRTGKYPVLESLATLSFDYPPRAKFFLSELEHYLLLIRDEQLEIEETTGSYAGAMGMPQFIASSYRNFAVDYDKDGKRDLWKSRAAIFASVANYFKRHGWKRNAAIAYQARARQEVNVKSIDKYASRLLKPHTSVSKYRKKGLTVPGHIAGKEYWMALNNFYVITRYNHSPMYALAVYQLSQEILAHSKSAYATTIR